MEKSQYYIGTPNGVVVCVERVENDRLCAELYHSYSREAVEIINYDQLIFEMEQVLDFINFPRAATNKRFFAGKEKSSPNQDAERARVMSDEELLRKHGDLGTFIIRVQHRQNSSWQGRITWADKNKTVYFRSIWEMVKLIASAIDTVSKQEDSETKAEWLSDEE